MVIQTPRTTNALILCWEKAENAVRAVVKEKYYDLGEEMITVLLARELEVSARSMSEERVFENAFLKDLQAGIHDSSYHSTYDPNLDNHFRGLIAEVTFHNKWREGKTGGDVGVVVSRPYLNYFRLNEGINFDCRQKRNGILCQAKLNKKDKSAATFTRSQNKVLPDRIPYLALLLYKYGDGAKQVLEPFQWQDCHGQDWTTIKRWLRKKEFPSPEASGDVIRRLHNGSLGTDNPEIIGEAIEATTSIKIRLGWPPGAEPPPSAQVRNHKQIVIYQRQHL